MARSASRLQLLVCAALLALVAACSDDSAAKPTDTAQPADTAEQSDTSAQTDAAVLPGPTTTTACADRVTLPVPLDPQQPGPWPVGARTLQLGGLTTEVWYPAVPGSEAGLPTATYDIRKHLAEADAAKISDAANPLQQCNCVRDLPVDTSRGPYPLIVFVHGTAAFRSQSLQHVTHWVSRGFVVVSQDHPGLELKDVLAFNFGAEQEANTRALLASFRTALPDFLQGAVDMTRMAAIGHSAGGGAIEALGDEPGMQVLIPLASGGTVAGPYLRSSLVLAGDSDGVVQLPQTRKGYDKSPLPKRLVVLAGAGHLAFSDLCLIGASQGGILQVALDSGIEVLPLIATLARDGCAPEDLAPEKGFAIIHGATSAALEEHLTCRGDQSAFFAALPTALPNVATVEQAAAP